MKSDRGMHSSAIACWMLLLGVLIVPQALKAQQTWQAIMGAQSKDMARQAMAFLPNELWVHEGDSITWTSRTNEGHTVSFLKQVTSGPSTGASAAGTSRPSFQAGCTGGAQGGASVTTLSGSNFNGTPCVNSGPFAGGANYTVRFPTAGNYKLVCLIHRDMTGVVHVLDLLQPLPHEQWFYDIQAAEQAREIVWDDDRRWGKEERVEHSRHFSRNTVITTGELVATGGGKSYLAIMRFLPDTIRVHVGETVEWTNFDPTEPHTITFGTEPVPPTTLVGLNATPDPDGARHGTLPNATPDTLSLNSGFIVAALQDQTNQTALGVTRVRVTFAHPGRYDYICALHDELGMKGKVIVVP